MRLPIPSQWAVPSSGSRSRMIEGGVLINRDVGLAAFDVRLPAQ